MEQMNDLRALLQHEVEDLYSAEEQIIEAMPAMIQKAKEPTLKNSLKQHLKITEQQKKRLDKVLQLLGAEGNGNGRKKSGGFFGLFGGGHECKGMKGLIEEGNKVMNEDMSDPVLDAAIIACAQKIEHYEICGYGTARAYARELGLGDVAELLEETLNEEYEADDRLTDLAIRRVNKEAEKGATERGSARGGRERSEGPSAEARSSRSAESRGNGRSAGATRTAKKSSGRTAAKKAAPKKAAKKSATKSAAKKRTAGRSK